MNHRRLAWIMFGPSMAVALTLGRVTNLRPLQVGGVPSDRLYRCATLDNLSPEDAQSLMDGTIFQVGNQSSQNARAMPLSVVMDLRNADEIAKTKQTRTEASLQFYQHVETSPEIQLVHVPILKDVDAFWDEAIARMEPSERVWATLQTITSAGALDRAAARRMENEGLSMLYTVTLATCQPRLRRALEICAEAEGRVIFHCQKGKDRTGLLAMLLQSCLGASDNEIVETYAESGPLIGETPEDIKTTQQSTNTFIDWSRFRGSPSTAMEQTLTWIQQRYGSVENFITNDIGLDTYYIEKLRQKSKLQIAG